MKRISGQKISQLRSKFYVHDLVCSSSILISNAVEKSSFYASNDRHSERSEQPHKVRNLNAIRNINYNEWRVIGLEVFKEVPRLARNDGQLI